MELLRKIAVELRAQAPISPAPQARAQHRLDCEAVANVLARDSMERATFLELCGASPR